MEDTNKDSPIEIEKRSPAVKLAITAALLFIILNLLFVAYASMFILNRYDRSVPAQGPAQSETTNDTDPFGRPQTTLDEAGYRKAFMTDYEAWLDIIDTLLYRINDRTRVTTKWDEELSAQVAQMQSLIERSQLMVPPEQYQSVHDGYMSAIFEFDYTADNLQNAIATKDAKLLNESMKRVVRGSSYLNDARNKLRLAR